MTDPKAMRSLTRYMDRAIRQPVTESGTCPQCNGSGGATFFSDFPCATCNGSGFVEADEDSDND